MQRFRWIAFAILVALAAAACGGGDDSGGSPPATRTARPAATATSQASGVADVLRSLRYPQELAEGIYLGRSNAPVTLTMFADFTCPHCLAFTVEFEGMIVEEYVAAGKVLFEFQNFPLRQTSLPIANAALCAAEQDRFWGYHTRLFLLQVGGIPGARGFDRAGLLAAAEGTGLDIARFTTCIDEGRQGDAVIEQARRARDLGLTGTPSFLVNGVRVATPASAEEWRKLLDSAVAEASREARQ
jgi:protein-disulfide isomerase